MVSVIKKNMETVLKDLRRWIRRHYPEAPNAPLMRRILEEYAQPLAEAVESVETSSEWMRHETCTSCLHDHPLRLLLSHRLSHHDHLCPLSQRLSVCSRRIAAL